ncbi:MAG: hypothetical protein AAFV98_08170 [Chloroflexota bacterium]
MLNFFVMIGFSLYLTAYGFLALFKRDWLDTLIAMIMRRERKSHEPSEPTMAMRGLALVSLVLGVVGVVMAIATLVIFLQAQNGVIDV